MFDHNGLILSELRSTCEGRTYYIHTYGCQMNVRDSQTIAGILQQAGFVEAQSPTEADTIFFNTCCVRQHAQHKADANIGALREWRKEKDNRIVGVCGCMVEQEGQAKALSKKYPFVDIITGPAQLHTLPAQLHQCIFENQTGISVGETKDLIEGLPRLQKGTISAFVNIMTGCDNYCTYCIVPYVRGREKSRQPEKIIEEIATLVQNGVQEVTLLGQNVNSYQGGQGFAWLLRQICQIEGLLRIRFMTSHPKDFSDDLITVLAEEDKLCKHVHLPVQSGSDTILKAMNRKYTRAEYLALVDRLRKQIPNLTLTTDFIVGFPGETDEDFEDSLSLCQQVRFDAAYIFLYSTRKGTAAASIEGKVPQDIIKARHRQMLAIQDEITKQNNQARVGTVAKVLFESIDAKHQTLTGKTSGGQTVHVAGNDSYIGNQKNVLLERLGSHTFRGTLVE